MRRNAASVLMMISLHQRWHVSQVKGLGHAIDQCTMLQQVQEPLLACVLRELQQMIRTLSAYTCCAAHAKSVDWHVTV